MSNAMKAVFENFDPNAPAQTGTANIFGLPATLENSDLVIVPVPWEVTTSYRPGTARGPEAILEASMQVDLYDADFTNAWKNGFFMEAIDQNWLDKNHAWRGKAEEIIEALEDGLDPAKDPKLSKTLEDVNAASKQLNDWVYRHTGELLDAGKKVALLGGDHSTPYGYIKALAERFEHFAVLQVDAHMDLRQAYEGFQYSHASIMYNVISDFENVELVQFGIRDYCDEEVQFMRDNPNRIRTYFDRDIKRKQYDGQSWKEILDELIDVLPPHVFISFDIDGLDPKLCPNTGTPVPGGFELEQIYYLLYKLNDAGKKLIGFDLNEVSVGDGEAETIDPIVGSRLLYKLCGLLVQP